MNLQSTDFDMQRRSKAKLRKIQVHEHMKYKEIKIRIKIQKLHILQMMWSRRFNISTTSAASSSRAVHYNTSYGWIVRTLKTSRAKKGD